MASKVLIGGACRATARRRRRRPKVGARACARVCASVLPFRVGPSIPPSAGDGGCPRSVARSLLFMAPAFPHSPSRPGRHVPAHPRARPTTEASASRAAASARRRHPRARFEPASMGELLQRGQAAACSSLDGKVLDPPRPRTSAKELMAGESRSRASAGSKVAEARSAWSERTDAAGIRPRALRPVQDDAARMRPGGGRRVAAPMREAMVAARVATATTQGRRRPAAADAARAAVGTRPTCRGGSPGSRRCSSHGRCRFCADLQINRLRRQRGHRARVPRFKGTRARGWRPHARRGARAGGRQDAP